jgi:hypothetical protein
LYLLRSNHKDKHDKEAHDEMGFEDFFDIGLLKSHQGFHIMEMKDFLQQEAVTGHLKGKLPPNNSTDISDRPLWKYLDQVSDVTPEWSGKFLALPDRPGDFNLTNHHHPRLKERIKAFRGQGHNDRTAVYYDETLQKARHIFFPPDGRHRLLQHYYAFVFFAAPAMASFYRRFVRDYMRYKDPIQCLGAELVAAVRKDALETNPNGKGEYYALHIRRGDFQYKEVKLSAEEIVSNLRHEDGTPLIPAGSLVYVSTDDPDGKCRHCMVNRKPCNDYPMAERPRGCPKDTSWDAFRTAGWKIRFLRDYLAKGYLADANPNVHGMAESIVCSRAKIFAGTYYSTFTGYIHRLRGYHGLGEETYYHSDTFLMAAKMNRSVGQGFIREWRAGWTDDGGELI